MKGHLYKVTVEHLMDNKGNPVNVDKLVFEARNHDDLMQIVQRIRSRGLFAEDEAAAFAIGLKLFGEVMLHNRDTELFKDLAPHFGDFMGKLKGGRKPSAE